MKDLILNLGGKNIGLANGFDVNELQHNKQAGEFTRGGTITMDGLLSNADYDVSPFFEPVPSPGFDVEFEAGGVIFSGTGILSALKDTTPKRRVNLKRVKRNNRRVLKLSLPPKPKHRTFSATIQLKSIR
ncbi:hypothetical protein C8N40_111106 [Pontibacter mucosus]|uniref:Uncharacterized protein n=1 Tax=Pontibacter mucosus TaxID=1649266 RepID=A0A2T5YD46_9BACT|nr:hypothetical protein [Pontibacter mucosus]PTX14441.1 hypothetical protein C8N40_111106 [Pontibacter mucosus]